MMEPRLEGRESTAFKTCSTRPLHGFTRGVRERLYITRAVTRPASFFSSYVAPGKPGHSKHSGEAGSLKTGSQAYQRPSTLPERHLQGFLVLSSANVRSVNGSTHDSLRLAKNPNT